jgi:hypothetical protein
VARYTCFRSSPKRSTAELGFRSADPGRDPATEADLMVLRTGRWAAVGQAAPEHHLLGRGSNGLG